jgi:glycerol-3-phosphate dehydrogenase (NAD(P)+)
MERARPWTRIAVAGAGAWGTALAGVAARAGARTVLLARRPGQAEAIRRDRRNPDYLSDHLLPERLEATHEAEAAYAGAEAALLVTPSHGLAEAARIAHALLPSAAPLVICAKGIDRATGRLMSELAEEAAPGRELAVLSGPSFAGEALAGLPTAVAIASACALGPEAHGSVAARAALTLGAPGFRADLTDDMVGVQIAGAAKNVVAIACGMASGAGMGRNTIAALMARGLREVLLLTAAMGGRAETAAGLAGAGDLTLTCTSEQSRNFSFGVRLGRGSTPERRPDGRPILVEGAESAKSVLALSRRLQVETPLFQSVCAVIHEARDFDEALDALWRAPMEAEALRLDIRLPHPAARDG